MQNGARRGRGEIIHYRAEGQFSALIGTVREYGCVDVRGDLRFGPNGPDKRCGLVTEIAPGESDEHAQALLCDALCGE